MLFLFAILAQYLSRGALLACCLAQEKWEVLVIGLLFSYAIGSPVQGWMSDRGSRKKLLLVAVLCTIASMVMMVIGTIVATGQGFVSLLGFAVVLNGVFGNVFPTACAAYSEVRNTSVQETIRRAIGPKYGGFAIPYLLSVPFLWGFVGALALNVVSFCMIAMGYKDAKRLSDRAEL